MNQEKQKQQWLEDLCDDEQDVAGSTSEDEIADDTPILSAHDSESEIEVSEDSENVPESSEVNYFLSRHTQRNDPKVK